MLNFVLSLSQNIFWFPSEEYRMNKYHLFFWLFLIYLLYTITNSAYATQTVYVGKKPDTLEVINKVKKLPGTPEQKLIYLINHGYIEKLDPKDAKTVLGIEWIEDDLPPEFGLPSVIILDMGPEVGKGLISADPLIKPTNLVLQYTGEVHYGPSPFRLKDQSRAVGIDLSLVQGIRFASELRYMVIDALNKGNAGCFANYLPNEEELSLHTFSGTKYKREDVATANVKLAFDGTMGNGKCRLLMIATQNIGFLEQVGFYYDRYYGYETSTWPREPLLFDKDCHTIPRENYMFPKMLQMMVSGILAAPIPVDSEIFSPGHLLAPLWIDTDKGVFYISSSVSGYGIPTGDSNKLILTGEVKDMKRILASLTGSRSRLSIAFQKATSDQKTRLLIAQIGAIAVSSAETSSTTSSTASSSSSSDQKDQSAGNGDQLFNGGKQSCTIFDDNCVTPNSKGLVQSLTPTAAAFFQNENIGNSSNDLKNLWNRLLKIIENVYAGELNTEDTKKQLAFFLQEIDNAELNPSYKEQFKAIVHTIESMLTTEFALPKHEDFNDIINSECIENNFATVEESKLSNKFLMKKFLPPAPFTIPTAIGTVSASY